jgi:peptide/nickel transport system substrate-binding protein
MTESTKMDRRKYLKYVGGVILAGAAAAAGYGLYEYTKPPPTPPTTTIATTPTTTIATTPTTTIATTPTAAPTEKVIVVAVGEEVINLDPANSSSYNWVSHYVTNPLYDQLTEYRRVEMKGEPGFYEYVPFEDTPWIAESWDWASDQKSIVYHIRKGVKFHDGTELTAQDVAYSVNRVPKTSTIGGFLMSMLNFDKAEAVDDYTLKISLTKPTPMGAKLLAMREVTTVLNSRLMKQHEGADDPVAEKWLAKDSAGSGAYTIDHWTPGVEFVLKANPNYWKGKPATDKIVLRYVPSPSDRVMMVQAGTVDIVNTFIPRKELPALETNPDVRIFKHVAPTFIMLHVNHRLGEPWTNKNFRKALAYAIPYDTIINKVYYGYAVQQKSPVSPGIESYTDEFWNYKYDLDEAKKYLDKTKWAGGTTVQMVYKEEVEMERDLMTWIQSEWKKIGVNVDLKPMPSAALTDLRVKGDAPPHIWESNPFVKDPFYELYWWYHSHAVGNWPLTIFYSNPTVDKLIDDNMSEMDLSKRNAASKECQRIIVDEVACLFLLHPSFLLVARKNINGLTYWCDESWGRSFRYLSKD